MTSTNDLSERGALAPCAGELHDESRIRGLTAPARRASRRTFLAASTALAAGVWAAPRLFADDKDEPALIAITLDLEMSRQYPTKDQMHWDYEKGNLNAETKAYSVEAGKRVKAH